MTRSAVVALAVVFAAAHLAFLPSSLEDIDSVNFALGVRDFDVAAHRPHPPGYPAYIGVAKAAVALTGRFAGDVSPASIEARAMALVSLVAGALAVFALYRLFAALSSAVEGRTGTPWDALQPRALAATALTASCPLYWYMAARPMSDLPGLAVAAAAQAALALAFWRQRPDQSGDHRLDAETTAASGRMIVLGALLTGLAIGFRTQATWITAPLLLVVLVDRVGRGVAGALLGGAITFGLGVAAWAVPLMAASGGVGPYLAALGSQAGEDFAGVDMLYLSPTPRLLALGLVRTFVLPWESIPLAVVVLALAAVGAVALLLRDRRTLMAVVALAGPYLIFHLLFQDTTFVRYALPTVPAVAFLAATGVAALSERAVLPAAGALSLWAVAVAAPVLASYAARPSPVVRALDAMRAEARATVPGALAMHQTYRRPLEAEDTTFAPMWPSPPRREWLALADYWAAGRTEPVWFLADPRRSDLALIDPQSRRDRTAFQWDVDSRATLGGMRPWDVVWLRLAPPGWFAGEGWALTPETAGIARLSGRGPHLGGASGWVRRRDTPARLLVGGRNLGADGSGPVPFSVTIDGRPVAAWDAPPGFFLHVFDVPASAFAGEGPLAALVVASPEDAGTPTAVEQFDLQPMDVPVWGWGEGWHEAEYEPARGVWHWTEARATLRVFGAVQPMVLRLRLASPLDEFPRASAVTIRAGDATLYSGTVGDARTVTVEVPAETVAGGTGLLSIETDQTFVPAERDGVSDRRRLGLRVFDLTLEPRR